MAETLDAEFDDEEIERRRDDALRRALNTPPKPKTKGAGDSKASPEPHHKTERET